MHLADATTTLDVVVVDVTRHEQVPVMILELAHPRLRLVIRKEVVIVRLRLEPLVPPVDSIRHVRSGERTELVHAGEVFVADAVEGA
jgi:hypothetical protein